MFGAFKKALKGAAREVQADYSNNKDFLEAVCAAAALVAAADGDIEDAERGKVIRLISGHATLGKMYQQNVIEQTAEEMFRRAKDFSGRQSLAREMAEIKARENGAQMAEDAYLIALDVAHADGEVEPQEEEVLKKIASYLGVDASKFTF